jgi:hypothetical protein
MILDGTPRDSPIHHDRTADRDLDLSSLDGSKSKITT